jgi:hypothetical protein
MDIMCDSVILRDFVCDLEGEHVNVLVMEVNVGVKICDWVSVDV